MTRILKSVAGIILIASVSLAGCNKTVDYKDKADYILSLSDTSKSYEELMVEANKYLETETLGIYDSILRSKTEINIEDIYMKDYNEFSENKHKALTVSAIDKDGKVQDYSENDLNIFTRDIDKLKSDMPNTRDEIIRYMNEIPLIYTNEEESNLWLDGIVAIDESKTLIGMSESKFSNATAEELREYALKYLDLDDTYSESILKYKDVYLSEFERMQKRREEALVEDFENPVTSDFITVNDAGEHIILIENAEVKDNKIQFKVFNREESVSIPKQREGYTEYTLEKSSNNNEFIMKLTENDSIVVKVGENNRLSMNKEYIETLLN